ncbi:Putative uncharacterized protein [Moritella viscosa]|uniref:Uncharacterized protein n=1 Tax=Moritella viscosa TaxID=80854 RepID=A0A1L0AXX4_9GAMM|nr:Putative uncharacterized protein [Moritella viscosa]SHO03126.1 Putative uncharacterized protein [Moritella viscosa]SHO03215.1 Putative uncharacterized protein [Moritella viscosa]SHO04007.1 Putative uncharacterized protein [Moritella viscosa]SHO08572.1 Putative uncharacterized protein [Moritella viscosa]
MLIINFISKYRQELSLIAPSVVQLVLTGYLFFAVATA